MASRLCDEKARGRTILLPMTGKQIAEQDSRWDASLHAEEATCGCANRVTVCLKPLSKELAFDFGACEIMARATVMRQAGGFREPAPLAIV